MLKFLFKKKLENLKNHMDRLKKNDINLED